MLGGKNHQNNTRFYKFLKHATPNTFFSGKHSYEATFLKGKTVINIKFRIVITSEDKQWRTVLEKKTQGIQQ